MSILKQDLKQGICVRWKELKKKKQQISQTFLTDIFASTLCIGTFLRFLFINVKKAFVGVFCILAYSHVFNIIRINMFILLSK